jgi:hypothetical protein
VKTLWLIPLILTLVAAGGALVLQATGIDPHIREMLFAAGACLLAGELAVAPILLARGASQASVAQAALVGSAIHLLGSISLGGALVMFKALNLGDALMYWLMAFYWATLIVLVFGYIRAIRTAPIETTGIR